MTSPPNHENWTEIYERGLEAFENTNRPDEYGGLTSENRKKCNFAQFESFARAYWPMWRLMKIRLLRRLLQQRDSISEEVSQLFPNDEVSSDSRTYQEITNGILASSASELCQYAEDLAILCNALSSDGFFAKSLFEYSVGRMQNRVISWKDCTREDCCNLLFIPVVNPVLEWPSPEAKEGYERGIDQAHDSLKAISIVYSAWQYHFMQYKHGLSYALSPYAGELPEDEITRRKERLFGYPIAFDASSISGLVGTPRFNGVLEIPDVSCDHIRFNALQLSRERNLLRYCSPPRRDDDLPLIDDFEKPALAVAQLQKVAIMNFNWNRNPNNSVTDAWKCLLPKAGKFVVVGTRI